MKNGRWLVVAGLLAALAGPAAAQETGLYFGGSIGQAVYKASCEKAVFAGTCKDNDTAWRAILGYQLSRNYALEVGYAYLGELESEGLLGTSTAEAKGFDLSVLANMHLMDRLSLLGRFGAYRLRANSEGASVTDAETSGGFTFGLGLAYDLGWLGLRAEWQRYDGVGYGSIGEDDIDFLSLGVRLTF
jgi:OOP family OmpA-OmpF porin